MTSASSLVSELRQAGLTIAVAESLTGGLVVAELVSVPGASTVVAGGVVAYQTELKHSLLGVSSTLLDAEGAVHPDVAAQMARGVRSRLAVGGRDADIGVATTGVAGPDPQDGQPVGTVFVGVAWGSRTDVTALHLEGDREAIRRATVYESLVAVERMLRQPRE
ncbi:competence damage-inducible protein A [Frondihabitans sucicola]|uniref:Competence damage-inducible protein A n=1 Tax=Frondihabitans sucicola TaxID=1268041 RepID=A0ABN6Y2I8_9MICO|nr:CinA family protein [Frondihabitans sucicola]BDZ50161.1 competence damage-inducible protein A [Frondihabitans sucicola]